MSVGKTADDDNMSIFTKEGVPVYKEEDVLITCQIKPIIIRKLYERGWYHISLTQDPRQWQPHKPTKKSKKCIQHTNSVYGLTSKEEAIKWMHAVCGYPVKYTWIKSIKAGNNKGWPMITERNVARYHPETTKTPKEHMNQTSKNVRSTKPKRTPLEATNTSTLQGQKVHGVYTKI